jgi:hypothetical protein
MGSLNASLWFNSIIALAMTPTIAKVIEILTKGDVDTMSNFMIFIKNNDMLVVSGLLFVISYIVATLGNISASLNKENCKTYNIKSALVNSIKVPVFVWIGFLLGVLFPIFQEPWINLLGETFDKVPGLADMVPYIVGGFVAMCLSWVGTALSHFSYIQVACKPNDKDILKKMNKSNE